MYLSRQRIVLFFILICCSDFCVGQDVKRFIEEHPLKGKPKFSTEFVYMPGSLDCSEIHTWHYVADIAPLYHQIYSIKEQKYLFSISMNKRFDSLNRLKEQEIYDNNIANPPMVYRIQYTYDSLNRLVAIAGVDPNKQYDAFRELISYNNAEHTQVEAWYQKEVETYLIIKKNDSLGRIIEEKQFDNQNNILQTTTEQYDNHGDVQSYKILDNKGHIIVSWVFKYSIYDNAGNWLKQTKYDANGNPVSEVQRVIEY
jgi:hypothetical protein